jgi:hypothetical protein
MKNLLPLVTLLFAILGYTQSNNDSISKYLEDQLYVAVHYNNFLNNPKEFATYGFSNGFSFGFIKDIPLNIKRNKGIGVGLGYAANSYKNNLKFTEVNNNLLIAVNSDGFITNKLVTNSIELPVEFRWRTSNPVKFKFWRIYTGFKISYLLKSNYSYADETISYDIKNSDNVNKWNYGLTLSAGYSTFNVYTYYGLKPIFKDFIINNENFSPRELKIGLIFYIL